MSKRGGDKFAVLKSSSKDITSIPQAVSAGVPREEQGTWVHPDVAVQIAIWISAEFAVRVSRIVRRFYAGDLTLAAETVQNHDALIGTTSTVSITTVLGKRKAELELDAMEAEIRAKNAAAARIEAELLREAMEYLKPAPGAPDIERVRAESDVQTLRAHYVKTLTGGAGPTLAITDGRGTEISFALLEQKMGVRLNKQQRQKAGKKMVELMRGRYGADCNIPVREEMVDGRVIQVKAYWSRDEDLMRAAIDSVL